MSSPKGKSTKQLAKGPKQILNENQSTLKFYAYVIGGVSVAHLGSGLIFFSDALLSWTYILMNIACTCLYSFSFFFLYRISRPTYSTSTGNLIDPGTDLNMEGGISEHAKDILLLTAITQALAILWRFGWLVLLLIPARATYLLWIHVLGPYFFAAPPEDDQANAGKKKEKRERKFVRQH